jgi:hypothetical protein
LQAALALSDFTDVDGVLSTLGVVALAPENSIDLRYAAFTSIERAGPTPTSLAILGQIAADETLGDAARTTLSAWHVPLATGTREEKLDDGSNSSGR